MIHACEVRFSHRVAWFVLGMRKYRNGQYSGLGVGREGMTGRYVRSVGGVRQELSVVGKAGVQFAVLRFNSIRNHQEAPGWQGNC